MRKIKTIFSTVADVNERAVKKIINEVIVRMIKENKKVDNINNNETLGNITED